MPNDEARFEIKDGCQTQPNRRAVRLLRETVVENLDIEQRVI
jgi:hypothetical protein